MKAIVLEEYIDWEEKCIIKHAKNELLGKICPLKKLEDTLAKDK